MAGENRTLGRGLDALLGAAPTVSASRGAGTLPIGMIRPGAFQPRLAIAPESLQELTASIKASGVIQAIVVRRLPTDDPSGVRYEIVAGERRWQAAKLAGLNDIPAIVRELSDQDALAIGLIENIQREELTATEEARSLKRLISEFSLTQQAVADSVGRSRAAVSNLIRLLELPTAVVELIDSKALGMGHARSLLALEAPQEQERVARVVVSQGLSVRQTEALVRQVAEGHTENKRKPANTVVTQILKTANVKAYLHQQSSGPGRLIVDFADREARDEMLELVKSYQGD